MTEKMNETALSVKSLKEEGVNVKKDEIKSFRDVMKAGILAHKEKILAKKNDDLR